MNKFDDLDVVIRRKNGKIIAGIPDLGLFARGHDLNAALAALEAKKQTFLADLEEAGELDTLEIERQPVATRGVATVRSGSDLSRFAMKAGIVVCLVVAALAISSVLIASTGRTINWLSNVKSVKFGGHQFWTRLENELNRMARTDDLPEAKKQKLLADIRAIAAKWRPFIVEIQSVLGDPSKPPRLEETPTNK